MQLNIGTSIRRLRQEKNVTQEELAGAIGVTAQAVSKWEREEGYPDITLLPEIARYFCVSLDTVCGLDERREAAEVHQIKYRALQAASYDEGVEIIREGMKKYPQSYILKDMLADQLLGCLGRWTPPQEILEEVIRLWEDVIERCSEHWLRNKAMSRICKIYELAGQHEKALAAVQRLPDHRGTRGFNLCLIQEGEELVKTAQNNLIDYMLDMDFMVWQMLDTDHYSAEEKIAL